MHVCVGGEAQLRADHSQLIGAARVGCVHVCLYQEVADSGGGGLAALCHLGPGPIRCGCFNLFDILKYS